MQGQGITRTSVIGCAGQTDFEVGSWFKADSLAVHYGLWVQRLAILADKSCGCIDELVSGILADEGFDPHGPQQAEDAWKSKWRDSANPEHSERLRVVAEHQRATLGWPPPQALVPIRELPVRKIHCHVSIQESALVKGRGRRIGRCREWG